MKKYILTIFVSWSYSAIMTIQTNKTFKQVQPFKGAFSKVEQSLEVQLIDNNTTKYIVERLRKDGSVDFRTEAIVHDLTQSTDLGIIWNGMNSNVYELELSKNGYGVYKHHKTKNRAIASLTRLMTNQEYRDSKLEVKLIANNIDNTFTIVGVG